MSWYSESMSEFNDFWETQQILKELARDMTTPLMYPLVSENIELPKTVDLGPVSRLLTKPEPGPCYICAKRTNTMFADKTPMCTNCAILLSNGTY